MENASGAAFCWPLPLLTCSFRPYPLILWITVLPPLSEADSARRSRTTERSESVSEEAEVRLMRHFLLTHLCGFTAYVLFLIICTDAT